jgi:pantetheine-phosphate adenylyltransferase
MSTIAVVPGSFDPVTLGHLDVIVRAAGLFDELHVLVVHNPGKTALIPVEQRVEFIEHAVADAEVDQAKPLDNVVVTSWSEGLLVDYCTRVGASVLVKGIRSQVDVAYETPMAIMNRSLAGVETVFLLPDPAHALVSSSLVRQVAGLGGDVDPYVPREVADYLRQRRQSPHDRTSDQAPQASAANTESR